MMWLKLAWASSPFYSPTLDVPCSSAGSTVIKHVLYDKNKSARSRLTSTRSSSNMLLLPEATVQPGRHRLDPPVVNAALPSSSRSNGFAGSLPRRVSSPTPLLVAILAATFGEGNLSRQRVRKLADSPAVTSKIELALSGGGKRASRAEVKIEKLLEAVLEVVGELRVEDTSTGATAAKVVTGFPQLMLLEGSSVLIAARQLREMEGMTEKRVAQLAIEFPAFFTLSPAARTRIGFFVGEVGLTPKDVARLAKLRPDVIKNIGGGHVWRLMDLLLEDLKVGKVAFLRMVRRQPGLLSVSVSGNVQQVTNYLKKEIGLGSDQISKIYCSHPQVLGLDLEKTIQPVVEWLGAPDPDSKKQQQQLLSSSSGRSVSADAGVDGDQSPSPSSLTSSVSVSSWTTAATPTTSGVRTKGVLSMKTPVSDAGNRHRVGEVDTTTVQDSPQNQDNDGGVRLKGSVQAEVASTPREAGGKRGTVVGSQGSALSGQTPARALAMPLYREDEGWSWGLGLGPDGRKKAICKQGDLLWKSVENNLAVSTAWFVVAVGLSWDEMRKLVVRSPALLSLSVENNLEPTLAFLVKELGLDPGSVKKTIVNQPSILTLSVTGNLRPKAAFFRDELGAKERDVADLLNRCPRVMNASVEGRILPRIQAMRAAGVPPAFPHLRALCTYPEERFVAWFEKIVAGASPPQEESAGQTTTVRSRRPPPRGRRLGGASDASRPSVRATSLAELGISYTASGGGILSRRGPATITTKAAAAGAAAGAGAEGVTATTGTTRTGSATTSKRWAEQEGEVFFAPGRADAKLLVRKLSRGLDVLDLCCGTGGFALNAAVGGARSVLGVDKAARAVRAAAKNAAANGLEGATMFVKADVTAFVESGSTAREEGEGNRTWDMVVVDLPSFPSESARPASRASRAVKALTRLAESVSLVVRPSGGMVLVVYEPGDGVFETPEEMAAVFTSAAARAGLSLSLSLMEAVRGPSSSASGRGNDGGSDSLEGVSSDGGAPTTAAGTTPVATSTSSSFSAAAPPVVAKCLEGRQGQAEGVPLADGTEGQKGTLGLSSSRDTVAVGRATRGGREGVVVSSDRQPSLLSPSPWFALFVCSEAPPLRPPRTSS